jgi:hypothetical protein
MREGLVSNTAVEQGSTTSRVNVIEIVIEPSAAVKVS